MSRIVLVLAILSSSLLFAKEVSLVKITNDEDQNYSEMYVVVDEYNNITQFGKKEFANGKFFENFTYSNDLGYAGIVLKRLKERDVVILRGLNVGPQNGGALEIDYLYNGITGSRGVFNMELDRTSDSWQLMVKGRIIKHVHFKSNRKRFVGTIGIRSVQVVK